MQFVYFTKTLQTLDIPGLIAFCKEVGLDGFDLAVRPATRSIQRTPRQSCRRRRKRSRTRA